MNLYKRGFHVLMKRVKRLVKENKSLKKEVDHLNNLLRLHEDFVFALL